jgi:hypothetical protein
MTANQAVCDDDDVTGDFFDPYGKVPKYVHCLNIGQRSFLSQNSRDAIYKQPVIETPQLHLILYILPQYNPLWGKFDTTN